MSIPSQADAPFHVPPDDPMIGGIVIDLPVPISVNKLRRINWREHKRAAAWMKIADGFLMMSKTRKDNPVKLNSIPRFELRIVLDERRVLADADNTCKIAIDYLRHRNVIEDDAPKNMRKLTVEWGYAPEGMRITVIPWTLTVNGILASAAEYAEAYP